MRDYQSLVDEAVALVKAMRGFIILHDPFTHMLLYEATQNFDPDANPYSEAMFLDLLADPEPRLTNNSIRQKYLPPGIITTLEPWHIILVPLKKADSVYGLLWCDRHMKQRLFSQQDLGHIVALVNQFHESL